MPVGEDQIQHIEFTRECAGNFNATYGYALQKPDIILCMFAFTAQVMEQ